MPSLIQEDACILSHRTLYGQLNLMMLESPAITQAVQPGQFVHMRLPRFNAHILRRPFSVYDWDLKGSTLEILYQVVGEGTSHMADLTPGDHVDLIGPVGNGWGATLPEGATLERVLAVGGGVGCAPLLSYCRQLVARGCTVDAVIGAQTKDALVVRERYTEVLGREPICTTDDGTYGIAGFATVAVEERLSSGCMPDGAPYDLVAVCGPPPLIRIVASKVIDAGIRCEVSLERRMACGVGACLSCVCDAKDGSRKRVCVDGPVFDAVKVVI